MNGPRSLKARGISAQDKNVSHVELSSQDLVIDTFNDVFGRLEERVNLLRENPSATFLVSPGRSVKETISDFEIVKHGRDAVMGCPLPLARGLDSYTFPVSFPVAGAPHTETQVTINEEIPVHALRDQLMWEVYCFHEGRPLIND